MILTMETENNSLISVDDVTAAIALPPGHLLGSELKARGIRQKDFAKRIGIQATHLSAIIHGMRTITPVVAEKIASGLDGIPASFWLDLQHQYNADSARLKYGTSHLVAGYQVRPMKAEAVLAEPGAAYEGSVSVRLSIPENDVKLLEELCSRLGWDIID